ncbi:50S ribosomal protein L29 [Candidatus Jidaibacter acanthamoeba]|uniref:Large ribosomal subunit protein uL29 n=1 Tax=Candidatus Jidaibacter acanthamoebae TaxID=86105 RepID=A0A0C1N0J2_9RICK|nr:50S ribosomal protein L29 [Candidatus Jidaibacter acanthamoeba]KIE05831.1 50S ribosomal protein L29 [Candidatus Jidaibacter acanthamoeba]
MKMSEIIAKTDKEILIDIQSLKRESMNLKFHKATGELTNPSRFKVVRKLIARYKTIITQRKNTAN